MASAIVDFDTKLTNLAAEILRDSAQVYNDSHIDEWLSGRNPVLAGWNSGMFGGLEMTTSFQAVTSSFQALTGSFRAVGQETIGPEPADDQWTLKRLFRLPRRLPGIRLPSGEELAMAARSAPIMVHLDGLARWLGRNGRPVTALHLPPEADATDAARWLGIRRDYLPYLWEHAIVSGWFEFADDADGQRSWVVLGQTAYRWADGDVAGTLHVWATVFASVLAVTLEVAADQEPDAARRLNFQGQGVTLAVMLFLARRAGLSTRDATDIVRRGTIGEAPTGRARKAWDAWVRRFGDPAGPLLRDLAALHAVVLPAGRDGIVALTPLAQWALREQFGLDKINVPVIRASGQLSVADLVGLVDGVSDAEFQAEFGAWLSRRDPVRAAGELLMYAGSASPYARLTVVRLVRGLGRAAVHAWLDAMQRPQLRGYARIALSMMAADLPESGLPLVLNPRPDDMDWVATDLLAVIGDANDRDRDRVAALFAEVALPGEEEWILGLLAGGRHPDIVRLLELLGDCHPDRRLAKSARKAARAAARNRAAAARERVPARAAAR
jgi:hypothetical protein